MTLQPGTDYILVKRAGYFDGRRTLQQHGNMLVTKNRMIVNILQTLDVMEKLNAGDNRPQSANPFKELKLATKDMAQSFKDAKEEFGKIKDFGLGLKILEEIAAESASLEELESRAAAMGEDEPKSLNISLQDIQSLKVPWIGPMKLVMRNGIVIKMFATKRRKDVQKFMLQYL